MQEQKDALDQIIPALDRQKGEVFLLYGPAGTGKTEVYMSVIEEALKRNQGAIILVPEIGLIFGLVQRFKERFNASIAVIHSGLTDKERNAEWQKISQGAVQIVIGTRMAIFSPVKNLKVVILDEENDSAYKSEQSPKYHARTVAEYLSENAGVTAILGSAIPSIESYYKAKTGNYQLITLSEKLPRPQIEVVDMRNEKSRSLSKKLRVEIKDALGRKEKIILFINRKGFFTTAICRECGYSIECPNCSASLTYHFKERKLVCGHCGHTAEANLICPKCQNSSIAYLGMGTQRIEEEVRDAYPQAKIVRIDRNSDARSEDADIIVGTQMVLNSAKAGLVGIISADSMLNLPDFRASEYAFQHIIQAAGNAGKTILQTYNPGHYAIKHAENFDYEGFYNEEIKHREELFYPPFSKLINIIAHGKDETTVKKCAENIAKSINGAEIKILGPVKSVIYKIRGNFRWQILLKGKDVPAMRKAIDGVLAKTGVPGNIRISIDMDPVNLF